jgi:hypothetical protein
MEVIDRLKNDFSISFMCRQFGLRAKVIMPGARDRSLIVRRKTVDCFQSFVTSRKRVAVRMEVPACMPSFVIVVTMLGSIGLHE